MPQSWWVVVSTKESCPRSRRRLVLWRRRLRLFRQCKHKEHCVQGLTKTGLVIPGRQGEGGMPQEIDDFTILLRHSTDMGACDLEVYCGLEQLWRMVDRYAMRSPISISVVDSKAGHVRSICGNHHQATGWKLSDQAPSLAPALAGDVEFPLTIRVQDARGNILKMRLQLRGSETENASSCQKPSAVELPHH
jgi:hypothetical protein